MELSKHELEQLIANPTERRSTELKRWIDPSDERGKAQIVAACIALRNNNGGYLLIGFDDKTGKPDSQRPADVRQMYSPDVIQVLIGQYALPVFDVEVEFVNRDGQEHPVIHVAPGVLTPVIAKKAIENPDNPRKQLLRVNTVYARTLHANLSVSTAEAQAEDYERIVGICFDNREADIGRFARRHLSNIDLGQIVQALSAPKPSLTAAQLALGYLDIGKSRFEEVRNENPLANPQFGTFDVAIVIGGDVPQPADFDDFYKRLQLNKPHHSSWSLWIGNRYPAGEGAYVLDDAWESLTGARSQLGEFDFWRAETTGRFYHLRPLWDDFQSQRGIAPHTYLDFALHTAHVTEAVSIGSYFARAMGCEESATILGFACRWTGLKGRRLYAWSEPDRGIHGTPAHQDAKTTSTTMLLETPESAFSPVVEKLVAPLFERFGAMKFQSSVIEGIVRKTLSQRY